MKNPLPRLLLGIALLTCACAKESTPAPVAPAPAAGPTAPTARASLTVNGAAIPISIGNTAYGEALDNGGVLIHRATFDVYLPSPAGAIARVKYYLSSSAPLGSIVRMETTTYNGRVTVPVGVPGTLTSRMVTTAAGTYAYLSGTFTADLGTGYTNAVGTFTDVRAN